MFRNHLLITFRSILKNKLFILINVFGMGTAVACCIVGYFAYEYDATFDAVHQNRETIYRIGSNREFENKMTLFGYAPLPLGEVVDKSFPDVDRSSQYYPSFSSFKLEHDVFHANLAYVDPDFFQMFSFDFIAGDPAGLKDKTSVLISETMAVRLFRTPQAAVGKTMTQVYNAELKEVKVAGVFRDPPMNTSFHGMDGLSFMNFENCKDEFKNLTENGWKELSTIYVQINDPGRVESVLKQLQPFIENNNKVREDFQIRSYVLDQFSTMANHDRAHNVRAQTWSAPPISAVIGSIIMGALILLIACFNLTNTAIAISSRRLKEIGIRKVMGSMRTQLIIQFIGETTFICFLALLVGLGLADMLIGGWNGLWQYMRLSPHYLDAPAFILFLIGVLFVSGIVAGSYPAFYISKFEPVTVLRGKLKFGGTNYFTRVLLGLQFAISLISVVSAIGFFQNARYQMEYDRGFDMGGAIIAWVNDRNEFETYRNALQQDPHILSMAGAKSGIFSNRDHAPVKFESRQAEVDIIDVGDNYLQTMDLKLLEGRDFQRNSTTDQKESIIITHNMATLFGWDQPIGKELIWKDTVKLVVIGVVKDVYTQGLWRELDPMMIRYVLPDQYSQIVVNTKAENLSAVNDNMKTQWGKVFPNRMYNGHMLASDMQEVSETNINLVYMYSFLGAIAMMLSATGLFSLVSLNIIKRMKEIGVRKVLGASVANIMRIVNTEFIIILSVASLLGLWMGYYMSNIIMSSIWKYYQGVNTLTFVVSAALLFTISFFTIGYKVYSVATMNPVNTLRDE